MKELFLTRDGNYPSIVEEIGTIYLGDTDTTEIPPYRCRTLVVSKAVPEKVVPLLLQRIYFRRVLIDPIYFPYLPENCTLLVWEHLSPDQLVPLHNRKFTKVIIPYNNHTITNIQRFVLQIEVETLHATLGDREYQCIFRNMEEFYQSRVTRLVVRENTGSKHVWWNHCQATPRQQLTVLFFHLLAGVYA